MGSYWLTAKLTHLGRAPGCHRGAPPSLRTSRSPGRGRLNPLSRLHAPLCGGWATRVPSAGRHRPPILPRGRGAGTQLCAQGGRSTQGRRWQPGKAAQRCQPRAEWLSFLAGSPSRRGQGGDILRKQGTHSTRGLLCARRPQGPEPPDTGLLSRHQEMDPLVLCSR